MSLEIQDLTVAFDGTTAVDDVSLTLGSGRVLAVLGPSGCGKSTLLRTVAGLEPPRSGAVRYDGRDLAGVPTHKRGFALMFQDGQLFEDRSVARNVGYPLRLRRRPRAEIAERVEELLDLVGLPGSGDRRPGTMSGGERQRVALARALAVRPRLLLLDEPLSALDASLRERLAGDLRAILREQGTTTLLVTHDQEEAFAVADEIAVMRDGRLVQTGTVEDVWRRPADAWTAAFLGYAHVVEGEAAAGLAARQADHPAWTALALRRSALRVDAAGEYDATITEVRSTPEQVRLRVDVDGVGPLEAVTRHGEPIAVGGRVRLALDRSRTAVLR